MYPAISAIVIYAIYLYFHCSSEEWLINSIILSLVIFNNFSSSTTSNNLVNKEQASSNFLSGMNSSDINVILFGLSQSSSIVWSNSIAYLNKLWTNNFNFSLSLSKILGIPSIIDTIISKAISLKLSSASLSSIIFPINIKISLKFLRKIFGSQFDKSCIESKHTFKLSISCSCKHLYVVSKMENIWSLNCFASFLVNVLHNNSFIHWTVLAFNESELHLKYILKFFKKSCTPSFSSSYAIE